MMAGTARGGTGVATVGAIAYLFFIGRAFVDWRYVYPEFVPAADIATTVGAIAFYLVVSAAWLWALFGVRDGRRSGYLTLIGLTGLSLVVGAVATWLAFCPFVCQTAFPLMETANSGGAIVGLITVVLAWRGRPPA